MIRPRSCMLALLAAVLLAGCGGDDTTEPTATTTTTEASEPAVASPTAMPSESITNETATLPATTEAGPSATPTAAPEASGDDEAVVTAIAEGLGSAGAGYTPEQAQCIGTAWVTDVGVDALQQGGVLDEDLAYVPGANGSMAEGDAEAMVDGIDGCADVEALLGDLREQLLADPSLSAAAVDLLTPIVESLDRDFLVAGYTGDLAAYEALGQEADACEELG